MAGCQPEQSSALLFDDEFNGTVLDSSKWVTCYWFGCSGFSDTGELETYSASHVTVGGGFLHLVATKENGKYVSGLVTSGRTGSSGPLRFQYQYGYAEARIKLPKGRGLWSGWWQTVQVGDTPSPLGEIDVIEHFGKDPFTVYMTSHHPDST
ncbi:MAG: glycoside hydrolase family 16 protein, partial [Chloroflexi bacterium]|nr:glycoside hydrolase family 16 protein [Chloroflexota bacterium]